MNEIIMDEPHTHDDATQTILPPVPTAMTPIDQPTPEERQRRSGPGFGRILATGAAVVVLGFGGGVGGYYAADHWSGDDDSTNTSATFQPSNSTNVSDSSSSDPDSDGATPRSIYARVAPAVVHIEARIEQQGTSFFGIPTGSQQAIGTGSGFVIDDKGHIVTNAHVVEDAKSINVSFGDDTNVPANVIGVDKSSDLAVIQVDTDKLDDLPNGLTTVPFGDSSKLQVGDPVLAIGNPFNLDRTLTTGVVSALQRDIPALNDFQIRNVIQTDAAVNPGNSGGPLLNMSGQVVGVNSQIESKGGGNDGIAFAIPSSTVQRIAKTLISDGSVDYAWLGVEGGQLTDELRMKLKLDDDQEGVLVSAVTPGSPAARAGLQGAPSEAIPGGDVILEFDGTKLTSMVQLGDLVDKHKPKDSVKVVVLRDGKEKDLTVKLGQRPDDVKKEAAQDSGGSINPFG
jgi:S1-C subfamily serine protease